MLRLLEKTPTIWAAITTPHIIFTTNPSITVLDYAFLATLTQKGDGTVIYADRCAIGEEKLAQMGIVFKKIPRDITRL